MPNRPGVRPMDQENRVEDGRTASTTHRSQAGFVERHVGPRDGQINRMLTRLGHASLEDLVEAALPSQIDLTNPMVLPEPLSEDDVLASISDYADRNETAVPMIGLGYHDTITPAVLRRNVMESPSWYTAYTPYQPEISQGRLEALLNFQTAIASLTDLPVANASVLDEATAVAEAVAVMRRSASGPHDRLLVDAEILPQTLAVLRTRCEPQGVEIEVADDLEAALGAGGHFGLVLQWPGASGVVRDHRALIARAHEHGAMVTVAADVLALTVLASPGACGADIAAGSSQRFGVPMGFGGPHAGYLAVRKGLERALPGRIVGVSVDADGRPAHRLALQTREQHIRRERATSNICTAQVLLAVMAGMYAVWHGPEGLQRIAWRVHDHARRLASSLDEAGVRIVHGQFFDTVLVHVPGRADAVVRSAAERGIDLGAPDADHVRIACDERTNNEHVDTVLEAFGVPAEGRRVAVPAQPAIPHELHRTTELLTHEVFHAHRSETRMLRYIARLAGQDYALDRGMIPLGSCTMKLNAAAELEPIGLPGFADVHPFAPAERTAGYREMIAQLEAWLAELTGYAAVSVQPNAGSQGEFAGLLAIRAYHRSRGESHRDVCLIPASAHGTNAASAVMAGMRVVVVATAEDGTIDVDHLEQLLATHERSVAAIMLTYPSTHGVYDADITGICARVHAAGGQVYIDGANLNALLGLVTLRDLGGDVSHLNLHKTFCIPHGGGGPGVGPVAVAEHLVEFLPTHPAHPDPRRRSGPVGPVSAAPFGSSSILPIAWAYIRLMGSEGLAHATRVAVLSANYVAARLHDHVPVLYRGEAGLVAHECILDLRELTSRSGITAEDVAKRLIDYGFHAPTLSFPVTGTLMVEPTESEDLEELDRFCDAMIGIRAEIDRVIRGDWPADDNPLVNAPHTAQQLAADWPHAYDRSTAVFPDPATRVAKYWPPVRRIDGAHGDRNLVCSCPPPEAYERGDETGRTDGTTEPIARRLEEVAR